MSSAVDSFNLLLYILKEEFSLFVIVYFVVINIVYFLMLISSFAAIVRYLRRDLFSDYISIIQSEFSTPISVLAPAYNEQATIIESVNSLLKLNYSKMEVIVINDGSKDETLDTMIREFNLRTTRQVFFGDIKTKPVRGVYVSDNPDLRNKLIVVDKENGGKADALNVGVNISHYPLFCAIDADSILEDDALLKVAKPFLEDDSVMAVGGIVRVANGCDIEHGRVTKVRMPRKRLPVFQIVEYFRAFLSGRMGWSKINGLLIISGAFGLFRKEVVIACDGYKHDTVGEDMELIASMHAYSYENKLDYKVVFVPDPVCWTEAPDTIKMLSRQRNRWHRGLLDTLRIHKSMLFNTDYGTIGMLSMPYYFLFELLGPAIEMVGYIFFFALFFLGYVNIRMFVLFFMVAVVYGMLFSVGAVLLEEVSFHRFTRGRDLFKLILYAVIENFGYRQMTVVWRIKGMWDYFRGVKSWGQMQRTGFAVTPK